MDPRNPTHPSTEQDAPSSTLSRRRVLLVAAASPLALGLLPAIPASAQDLVSAQAKKKKPAHLDPFAGSWRTWLLPSVGSLLPRKPLGKASAQVKRELQELRTLQKGRGQPVVDIINHWDEHGGTTAWMKILLDKIKSTNTNPIVASRALALVSAAMADASIAAWNAKFTFNRAAPAKLDKKLTPVTSADPNLPAYVSEHAAIAHAAATILSYLWPGQTALVRGQQMTFEAAANECCLSRLHAGACLRTDMELGALIGQAAGFLAVQRAKSDGSNSTWDSTGQPGRLLGPQFWVPTAPGNVFPPLLPLAGFWRCWHLQSGNQFRPPVPPGFSDVNDSNFIAAIQEVADTVANLTPEQLNIAQFWADGGGTFTPPGHWADELRKHVAASEMTAVRAARAFALHGTAMADAATATWEAKFVYWLARPLTMIRTLSGQPFHDPNWLSPVVTPPFPAYTSGHSGFSGASGEILEFLFPGGTVPAANNTTLGFRAAALEAMNSRLFGGIHYSFDNLAGLDLGKDIAALVIQRAQTDGA